MPKVGRKRAITLSSRRYEYGSFTAVVCRADVIVYKYVASIFAKKQQIEANASSWAKTFGINA